MRITITLHDSSPRPGALNPAHQGATDSNKGIESDDVRLIREAEPQSASLIIRRPLLGRRQ